MTYLTIALYSPADAYKCSSGHTSPPSSVSVQTIQTACPTVIQTFTQNVTHAFMLKSRHNKGKMNQVVNGSDSKICHKIYTCMYSNRKLKVYDSL